ncbi:inositol polyphosphate 1-phosphatase [Pieris rapae]|uniref:inositol polyphosphate 1-phosphatase n=1 Tax=Pieris rapae TaxID=64459 RepID=UPI001E27F477|nr:inositol polyphosphate 1-phosphatase [Pieris rapae]
MLNILEILIFASEKAARIARSCAINDDSILIAEKSNDANPRFDKDFKTIADVLAQEAAKSLIVSYIPELKDYVRGEECSDIGGVSVSLKETLQETIDLLKIILPEDTAKCMAEAAHSDIDNMESEIIPNIGPIDYSDLGVWIDPIDGTAEFISGVRGEAKPGHGLQCVTVLIGAYKRSTGEPVVGVINQPFYNNGTGRVIWGINYGDIKLCSHEKSTSSRKIILMSSAENENVISKFKDLGWEIQSVPGAGHKLLKIALGEATAYIVSKGTTFRWDTCGPHSILSSLGGDIINFTDFALVKYNDPDNLDTQMYCNTHGIIAFLNQHVCNEIQEVLKEFV